MKFDVMCVGDKTGERYFTIGKTYAWKDAEITADNGFTYKSFVFGSDPDKWQLSGYYKFKKVDPCDSKILITSDGVTTTAKQFDGKTLVKTETAKCAPDDTYEFGVGAKLAFDRLMNGRPGKVDKPVPDKPDKGETVKLYCIKDYCPGEFLTKGKMYSFENGAMQNYDDGWRDSSPYGGFDKFCASNKDMASCLIPLIKRPAKVGEWVYVTEQGNHNYKSGEIYKVGFLCRAKCKDNCVYFAQDGNGYVTPDQYLVLSGYAPEPEQPKYYSGKVVCIENSHSTDRFYTVGKVYTFKDGETISDQGSNPCIRKVNNFADLSNVTTARFIPLID